MMKRALRPFSQRRALRSFSQRTYPDTAIQYIHPWMTTDDTISFQPADASSRYLWQLLRDLHLLGGPRNNDKATLHRCQDMLNKLSQYPDAALRSERILRTMTLFDEPTSDPLRELPRPNKNIFNTVLKTYSITKSDDRIVPDRALDIVKLMEQRYERVPDALDCQPFAFHYNCVLQAWKECKSWERSAHAAYLLLNVIPKPDAACYITLLKICAHNADDRERELGSKVALKLWRAHFAKSNPIENAPSHLYAHFLQALRTVPLHHPVYEEVFQRAIQHGKVNEFILNEFFVHAKSQALLRKFLPLKLVKGMSPSEAIPVLLEALPIEYKQFADYHDYF